MLIVRLWLIGLLLGSVYGFSQTTRMYFPSQGDLPQAVGVILSDSDSQEFLKVFGDREDDIYLAISAEGPRGPGVRLIHATYDQLGIPQTEPQRTSPTFAVDNLTGKPSMMFTKSATGRITVWLWMWAADEDDLITMEKQFSVITDPQSQDKYVRFQLQDPADGESLYRRMNVEKEVENRLDPQSHPGIMWRKAFLSSDEEAFQLVCFHSDYHQSSSCVVEVLLSRATIIDPKMTMYTFSSTYLQQAKDKLGFRIQAKSAILAEVRRIQAELVAEKKKADEELIDRFAVAAAMRRGYSRRPQPSYPGRAFYEAVGADALRAIMNSVPPNLGRP